MGVEKRSPRERQAEAVGLPPRLFLYTLDQVSTMLGVELPYLKNVYIYYEGRSIGISRDRLGARNIAPSGVTPEWRVSETELIRWFRFKRFKVYERGWLEN